MKYTSSHSYYSYITAMKEQMSGFSEFGIERFTGTIIGGFFSITYHSGHEFNRRITNEKHRAIGIVRPDGNGTKISCIRLAGMTNPLSLIGMYVFCFLLFLIGGGIEIALMPNVLWLCAGMTAFVALATAFTDSITEKGQEGSKILTAFLIDPLDFYSIVDKV
jgi:hypothetical protein